MYTLTIQKNGASQPTLNSVLANPGATDKATLSAGVVTADLGLSGLYKIKTILKQTDCLATTRYTTIGLDAGYRISTTGNFSRSDLASNNAISFSGWYAGIRVGFGTKSTRITK